MVLRILETIREKYIYVEHLIKNIKTICIFGITTQFDRYEHILSCCEGTSKQNKKLSTVGVQT